LKGLENLIWIPMKKQQIKATTIFDIDITDIAFRESSFFPNDLLSLERVCKSNFLDDEASIFFPPFFPKKERNLTTIT